MPRAFPARLTAARARPRQGLGIGSSGRGEPCAGAAGSVGASALIPCDHPLGTAALVEPESYRLGILGTYGLRSPVPVLRLLMARSNYFRVVALTSIQAEDTFKQSGMPQSNSTTARGRMIAPA